METFSARRMKGKFKFENKDRKLTTVASTANYLNT